MTPAQQTLDWTHHAAPGAPTLRPYQTKALDDIDAALLSHRAVVAVAPTGSGKTVIAAEFIRRRPDDRILFLAPRRELVHQTCRKLDDVHVKYGVLMAGSKKTDRYARVQVASFDTLLSSAKKERVHMMPPDAIIWDECHTQLTTKRLSLLERWPNAKVLGLTATPCRADGKTLGRLFEHLIEVSSVRELTERGFLVPARYFSVSDPDLKRVRTTAGDYNLHDLAAVTNTAQLVGDVVEHWLRHASDRRTVVFNVDINHSAAVAARFNEAGVSAIHVDANTPSDQRDDTFKRFASGAVQVLCNCTLASIGFDLPELDAVILNRPTKSLGLYLQMLGRGLRTAPGKSDCLVLDHAGNVRRHGFATDERFWTLSGTYAVDQAKQASEKIKKAKEGLKQITCPQCKCTFEGSNQCPACKYTFPVKKIDKPWMIGELVELTGPDRLPKLDDQWTVSRKVQFYSELCGIARARNYKPGWAAVKFKDRFGTWPDYTWNRGINENGPAVPSTQTLRWVQSEFIRWSKGKAKAKREAEPA